MTRSWKSNFELDDYVVEDHPDADRLYVVKLDDGSEQGRTICAGIKAYYTPDELLNKSVVFVANLKPRPLRGVVSEE